MLSLATTHVLPQPTSGLASSWSIPACRARTGDLRLGDGPFWSCFCSKTGEKRERKSESGW